MRHPRSPVRTLLAVVAVTLVAACSAGGSDGGGNQGRLQLGDDDAADETTTSTTTYVDAAKERNLQSYLDGLRSRSSTPQGAVYDSPAGDYASFLATLPPGAATVEGSGAAYRLCGPGQPAGCSRLTDFVYDGNGMLTDLSIEGLPVRDRLRGDGITGSPATGSIASVGLQWAYLRADGTLFVVDQYWWNDEVSADTNGCAPQEATYSKGGPVVDPQGGGKGSDPLGPWLMVMQFPNASLGGEVKVPCYRTDGSSEVFTQLVLG